MSALFAFLAVLPLIADKPLPDAVDRELQQQQGTWAVTTFIHDGEESPEEITRTIRRIVRDDHAVWERDGKSFAGTRIELNPATEPKAIDVVPDGGPARGRRVAGIYRIEGETLTICMASPDRPRPESFEAGPGSGRTLMVLRRH